MDDNNEATLHDKLAAIMVVEGAIRDHDSLLDLARVCNVMDACEIGNIGNAQRLDPCNTSPGKLYRAAYRELLTGTIARLTDELKGVS